jgi:hypothetical protein
MVIWKKIRSVLGNPIVQLLGLPGIIIVITWIVTHLAEIPIWEIWLAVVFMAGCGFWMSNQINAFRERHKKGFSKLTNAEMEDTLRKWVDKRQYSQQKIEDKESLFYFVATDEQKRHINIKRPGATSNVIQLVLAFDEKRISEIPEPGQQNLRFSIGVEMARFGLLYSEKPIGVHLDLPIDDLITEHAFLNAIDKVRQAHVLMGAYIQMAIATTKTPLVKKQDPET